MSLEDFPRWWEGGRWVGGEKLGIKLKLSLSWGFRWRKVLLRWLGVGGNKLV